MYSLAVKNQTGVQTIGLYSVYYLKTSVPMLVKKPVIYSEQACCFAKVIRLVLNDVCYDLVKQCCHDRSFAHQTIHEEPE